MLLDKQTKDKMERTNVCDQEAKLLIKQHQTDLDGKEKRKYHRFDISLNARFMCPNKQEHNCTVTNISIGGGAFTSEFTPEIGEELIMYIDDIGRVEALVARTHQNGFAAQFKQSEKQLHRMAIKISWLVDHMIGNTPDNRRHVRYNGGPNEVVLTLKGGIDLTVKVIDFSISGAAVETTARPEIGSRVMVNKVHGEVARHLPEGIAIRFSNEAVDLSEFEKSTHEQSIKEILGTGWQ